jgi:hypothetical protein
MAFIPLISVCLESVDDEYQLVVSDITDVYDAGDNTTGWENAATLNASELTAATLTITDPDDEETVIDVLAQIADPVAGTFEFDALTSTDITIKDGRYKVLYTLTVDADEIYTVCVVKIFYPNIKCCISKLVNRLRNDPNNDNLFDTVNKVKAWEQVLRRAARTGEEETASQYITLLQNYCDYNECGCH